MQRRIVDVVVPTCNRPALLQRALDSVLSQTHADLRCTVVAVAAKAATVELLEKVDDPRLNVLHAPQMPAAQARNLGAGAGAGELIAFCDDDNTWRPRFLEVLVDAVQPPYVLAYAGQQCYLTGGSPENLRILDRKVRSVPFNPVDLIENNYIDTSSAVLTREVFEHVHGFDEDLLDLEDWDLFARIALSHPYRVRHIDEVLGDYFYYLPEVMETTSNAGRSRFEIEHVFRHGDCSVDGEKLRRRLRALALSLSYADTDL